MVNAFPMFVVFSKGCQGKSLGDTGLLLVYIHVIPTVLYIKGYKFEPINGSTLREKGAASRRL